jgi:hypothetical protein
MSKVSLNCTSTNTVDTMDEDDCCCIPRGILQKIADAGGTVSTMNEDEMPLIQLTYGDEAYKIFDEWVNMHPNLDPIVHVVCAPLAGIENMVLCPAVSLWGAIQREARSVVYYYQSLQDEDFEEDATTTTTTTTKSEPVIGKVIDGVGGIYVRKATIAVSRLGCAIQNCPYDTINQLKVGSYICNLVQTFEKCEFSLAIFKAN